MRNRKKPIKYFNINQNCVENGKYIFRIFNSIPQYSDNFYNDWIKSDRIGTPSKCLELWLEINDTNKYENLYKAKCLFDEICDDVACKMPDYILLEDINTWELSYDKVKYLYKKLENEMNDKYCNKIIKLLGENVKVKFFIKEI